MSSFDATTTNATTTDLELPPVDEHVVEPGTRYEMLDGELVYVPPAHEPHGTAHSKLAALVEAHAGPEFVVACEMLTRTSKIDNFAPDVSVFPRARDPRTGGRLLEHLAFEVVSTQSLGHAGRKAAKLVGRGVRRVFAIHIARGRALEWSRDSGAWQVLDASGWLEDPALAAPLPIKTMLDAARSDDAVAQALLFKRNPVLVAAIAEAVQQAVAEGLAEALLDALAARRITVTRAARARILDESDPDQLRRWIARAAICSDLDEVLGAG